MQVIQGGFGKKDKEETEKTILVMGGSRYHDRDVPMQLVAQRDMIKREVEYYNALQLALKLVLNGSYA